MAKRIDLNITKITVIEGNGADKIYFETDELPEGCWPYEGKASLRLDVAQGTATDYLRANLDAEPTNIIKVKERKKS